MGKRVCMPMDRERLTKGLSDVAAGMAWYEIACGKCGKVQGYCSAVDDTLEDWDEFHYVQRVKIHKIKVGRKAPRYVRRWHGCMSPNVSPTTRQLRLECCCGQDTREFRIKSNLSQKEAEIKERENRVGREFGRPDSKFLTRIVGKDMIPFS